VATHTRDVLLRSLPLPNLFARTNQIPLSVDKDIRSDPLATMSEQLGLAQREAMWMTDEVKNLLVIIMYERRYPLNVRTVQGPHLIEPNAAE